MDSDDSCLRPRSSDPADHVIELGPLADNGGPTETHALPPDSPAVDAATGDCPASDQRGASRPYGSACDVGAFELNPTFGATTSSLQSTDVPQLATVTPTAPDAAPTLNKDSLCWNGPGAGYEVVQSIDPGVEVELVGTGPNGEWFVIDSPRYPGRTCWLPNVNVDVGPDFDLSELTQFAIPPLPTATSPPGCLYQGPNDNAPVCYPIDACPVPFDQTEGACVP